MFCKNCGKKLEDSAKFCPECGTKTLDEAQQKAPVVKQEDQPTVSLTEAPEQPPVQPPVQPAQQTVQPPVQPPVQPAQTPAAPTNGKNSKLTMILIISILAVVILILVVILVIPKGDKEEDATAKTSATEVYDNEAEAEAAEDEDEDEDEKKDSSAKKTALKLSSDLYDYTIEIEGVVYQFPCDFDAFADQGWTISSSGISKDSTIKGSAYESYTVSKDGKSISIFSYNMSGNAKKLSDCKVGGVSAYFDQVDFKLPKNITAKSTAKDIKAAYGEPYGNNIYDEYEVLEYKESDSYNNYISFRVYKSDEKWDYSSFTIKNFVKHEDDNTKTNEKTPAYLSEYKAPKALSKDITAGTFKLGGKIYKLPTPLSVILADGWKVTYKEGAVAAGGTGYITIEKSGKEFDVRVTNFADYQTTVENCAVTSFSLYESSEVAVTLPCGDKLIGIGTKKSVVDAVISDEFSYSDSGDSQSYYYSNYDGVDVSVTIRIDKETKVVSNISIYYETWDY